MSVRRDPLVVFLYILLRDHLASGAVEGIMEKHVERVVAINTTVFTNGYLAQHAGNLALRLRSLADEEGRGGTAYLAERAP